MNSDMLLFSDLNQESINRLQSPEKERCFIAAALGVQEDLPGCPNYPNNQLILGTRE